MKGEIVPFRYAASDLNINFEELSKDKLKLQPMKAIINAWSRGAKIDSVGRIWVEESEIHNILRTTKSNGNYISLKIDDKYKTEQGGVVYIQGSEVGHLLDDVIQSGGSISRRKYARFSEELYRIIRDSEKPELLRYEYLEAVKTTKKKLKSVRIKKLKIGNDELTNRPLQKNSEFSHIRIASIYIDLADKYWNGLIVNRDTHRIITMKKINDEDQLYDLCEEKGWNTEWFSTFCESLASL